MGLTPQQGVGLHLEVGGVFYATRSYLVITHPLVAYCIVCYSHYLDITGNVVAL